MTVSDLAPNESLQVVTITRQGKYRAELLQKCNFGRFRVHIIGGKQTVKLSNVNWDELNDEILKRCKVADVDGF